MKKIVKGCAVILAMTLLAGCSLGENASSAEAEKTMTETSGTESIMPKHVGLIYPSLSNEFLSQQAEAVKNQLEEAGCKVELVSSDNDSMKELQQLENYASMGVDTIMVFPIGATAGEVGNTLLKLKNQGIRIVAIGSRVSLGTFDTMVIVNQADVGKISVKLASEWIDETFPDAQEGSIEVGIIQTTTSVDSKTLSDVLPQIEQVNPKAKVVEVFDQPFGEPISKVQDAVDVMLIKNPDIKVILTYDSGQALAVSERIMGKNDIDKSTFGVFGNGIDKVTLNEIKNSRDNKSVLRGSSVYGSDEEIVKAVLGEVETDADHIYFVEIREVNHDNVDDYIE